jgi:hypothetical protein
MNNDAIFRSFRGVLSINVTAANFISSTVPEPDPSRVMGDGSVGEVVFNPAGTTTKNQRRYLASTHRVYRDSVGGAATGSPDVDVTRWVDEGPTNKWAWADRQNGTYTEAVSSLVIVLAPRSISAIGFSGLVNVATVRVRLWDTDGGNLVLDQVHALRDLSGLSPWWSWFFLKPVYMDRLLISDLPPHPEGRLELTFTAPGATTLRVGSITPGGWLNFGGAEITVRAKLRDHGYSITDQWGNSIDNPGAIAQDLTCRAIVPRDLANSVHRSITKTLRRRVFWAPSSRRSDRYLLTDGVLTSAELGPDNSAMVAIDFDIEGRT